MSMNLIGARRALFLKASARLRMPISELAAIYCYFFTAAALANPPHTFRRLNTSLYNLEAAKKLPLNVNK